MSIDAFLVSVEDNVLLEKLVDLLPLAMLTQTDDGAGLVGLGDHPPQASLVVLLIQTVVDLAQSYDVALVLLANHDVVLEDRDRDVPQVQVARQVL